MELQLRRMLAKVTVMDSEALLMSSVRIVDMAPGEKDDDCFSSCVLLPLLSVLPSPLLSDVVVVVVVVSSVFKPRPSEPETNHSISRSTKTEPKRAPRNRLAILS